MFVNRGIMASGALMLPSDIPARVVFGASEFSSGSGTTFTSAALAIGPASASRVVAAAISYRTVGAASPTNVTIGGITATSQASGRSADGWNSVEIWTAVVPTGTTAVVFVDWGVTAYFPGVATYSMYNLKSAAATDSGSSNANPGSISNCDVLAGGVVLSASFDGESSATVTWSGTLGILEDYDAGTKSRSGASKAKHGNSVSETIIATYSSFSQPVVVAAAFR